MPPTTEPQDDPAAVARAFAQMRGAVAFATSPATDPAGHQPGAATQTTEEGTAVDRALATMRNAVGVPLTTEK